jgi:hypothetical protein
MITEKWKRRRRRSARRECGNNDRDVPLQELRTSRRSRRSRWGA